MSRACSAFIPLLLAGIVLLAPHAGAGEEGDAGPGEPFTRSYPIHHLDLREAEVLAWDQCPPGAGDDCLVVNAGVTEEGRFVAVHADAATHQRIARQLLEEDAVPATLTFQVVLVMADRGTDGAAAGLPDDAARALEDARSLLPFSRYRLADAGWIRTTREGQAVLTGPDGLPVEVHLRFRDRVGDKLFVDGFRVVASHVPPGKGGLESGRAARQVLATSFAMEVGETLVVGTSRLDGPDRALVVLLTATVEE